MPRAKKTKKWTDLLDDAEVQEALEDATIDAYPGLLK